MQALLPRTGRSNKVSKGLGRLHKGHRKTPGHDTAPASHTPPPPGAQPPWHQQLLQASSSKSLAREGQGLGAGATSGLRHSLHTLLLCLARSLIPLALLLRIGREQEMAVEHARGKVRVAGATEREVDRRAGMGARQKSNTCTRPEQEKCRGLWPRPREAKMQEAQASPSQQGLKHRPSSCLCVWTAMWKALPKCGLPTKPSRLYCPLLFNLAPSVDASSPCPRPPPAALSCPPRTQRHAPAWLPVIILPQPVRQLVGQLPHAGHGLHGAPPPPGRCFSFTTRLPSVSQPPAHLQQLCLLLNDLVKLHASVARARLPPLFSSLPDGCQLVGQLPRAGHGHQGALSTREKCLLVLSLRPCRTARPPPAPACLVLHNVAKPFALNGTRPLGAPVPSFSSWLSSGWPIASCWERPSSPPPRAWEQCPLLLSVLPCRPRPPPVALPSPPWRSQALTLNFL